MRAVENRYHIKFQIKKYRRIISLDTEKRPKLWRKFDFLFEKWLDEFGELVNFHFDGLLL